MGLGIGFSNSTREYVIIQANKHNCEFVEVNTTPNPNPYNFKIKWKSLVNGNTILLVNYPDCNTFDGNKLILMKGDHSKTKFSNLDPHFFESCNNYIIGRFRPDKEGKKLAILCAKNLNV